MPLTAAGVTMAAGLPKKADQSMRTKGAAVAETAFIFIETFQETL
jgi:hypothetical protein